MLKIVLDAGHGLMTPGKQTPDGEKEWSFNERVLRAASARLRICPDVLLLRVDDPTGKADIPLKTRTDQANAWKADVYISFHHNANTGSWGDWGGVETYTMDANGANPESVRLAQCLQPKLVRAMGLRDRGVRKKNLHVLRETRMPAVLIEGGFMDSRTDIAALRNAEMLSAQGEAVAEALIEFYGLSARAGQTAAAQPKRKRARLVTGTFPSRESSEQAAGKLRADHGWTVYVKEE